MKTKTILTYAGIGLLLVGSWKLYQKGRAKKDAEQAAETDIQE